MPMKNDLTSRLPIWDTDAAKKYANLDRLSLEEGNFGKHPVSVVHSFVTL